jgi:hypothetical protein
LLYHYLPELEAYKITKTDGRFPNPERLKPLNLLVQSIKDAYKSTRERFNALVKDRKIIYDLL